MIHSVTVASGEGTATLQSYAFEAMGTHIEFLLDSDPTPEAAGLLRSAEAEVRRIEALLSRFSPSSELSSLNRDGRIVAGVDLLNVVEAAVRARELTGGRFDPTVHDALVAEGYDRTFEKVPATRAAADASIARCGGDVRIDRQCRLIELEPGFRLDLGGIAKGYTVDRVGELLSAAGPCLVNAGGDIVVHGTAAGPWPVGVETPSGPLTLALAYGALATSGCDRRRWQVGGAERHHLIDPQTGRSAETDLLRVTVIAATAIDADVWAKTLFLVGERAARREADALGLPCLLVTTDDRTVFAGGLA